MMSRLSLLLCCLLSAPGLSATAAVAADQAPARAATPAAVPASPAAEDPRGDELRRAASAGDSAKVRELLAAGVDVNAANRYGATALAYACDKGHTEVVKLLLDKGANPNTRDSFYKQTPLAWAVGNGHTEIVRTLLDKGAEGEAEALAGATASGNAAIVQVILERGKVGAAALSEALAAAEASTEEESKPIAELLRKAGVQPPPEVKIDPAVLQSYVGSYEPEGAAFRLVLVLRDGKLRTEGTGGPPLTLVPIDETHFRALEFAGFKVTFNVKDGKVLGATADSGGRITEVFKIEAQEGTKP